MRALIIGAAGFVGKYLIEHLLSLGYEVAATCLSGEKLSVDVPFYHADITNTAEIATAISDFRPDHIYHLAAQSSVALSWKNPALTAQINICGTINLLEAIRQSDKPMRVLLVGSSEEYGDVKPEEVPISETVPLRPGNVYAVTKASCEMVGRLYAKAYNIDVIMTRSFNHIGPGQADSFVVPSFCRQVAEIESGLREPVIKVGNLEAKRDFTDVRDVVRAYALLIERGVSGETYNVGSGKAVAIAEILQIILSLTDKSIRIEQDPERLRPSETPDVAADISRLTRMTGWQPEVALRDTLDNTLGYWRKRVVR